MKQRTPGDSTVNFNGGTVRAIANQPQFITNLSTANIQAGGLIVDSNGFNVATNQSFGGVGSLTKKSAGTFTMTAGNTYAGNTVIEAGTLSITNPTLSLADAADVLMNSTAIFDLNFSGTDAIRSLFVDGVAQAVGTWGSLASLATNKRAFFTGNGILNVMLVPAGVPGDYNGNGTVDAADYVLWRNGGPLQNEVETVGSVTAEDYTAWRSTFRQHAPGIWRGR